MRRPPHTRLSLETLEDRSCPSVYAHLVGGSLVVSGSTPQLTITEVAEGVFRVRDDQTIRGQFRVSQDIELDLNTRNSDRVTLNLNHHATPGNVRINLGQDAPILSIFGGTIKGNLIIEGASAHATVALGEDLSTGPVLPPPPIPVSLVPNPDAPPGPVPIAVGLPAPNPNLSLHVAGNTFVRLDNSGSSLGIAPWVQLSGSLTTGGVGSVWLSPGSSVAQDVEIIAGTGPTSLQLNGSIAGSLDVRGGSGTDNLYFGALGHVGGNLTTEAVHNVLLDVGSSVGGSAIFSNGNAGSNAIVGGNIGGSLDLLGGSATDSLYVERTATIGHNVWAWLGSGADSAKLRGIIRGELNIFAGTGSDTVSLGGIVDGSALVLLGDGDNSFTLLGSVGMSLNGKETALTVYTGMGKDSAAFAGNAVVNGGMLVNLGGGDDVVSFGDGFRATSGVIDGGTGVNGFYNFAPSGVRLVNFQFGVA